MVQPTLRSVSALLAISALCACQGGLSSQSALPNQASPAQLSSNAHPDTGGMIAGCPYPSGNVYQTSIVKTPLVTNSAKYISAVMAAPGGSAGFQVWTGLEKI